MNQYEKPTGEPVGFLHYVTLPSGADHTIAAVMMAIL